MTQTKQVQIPVVRNVGDNPQGNTIAVLVTTEEYKDYLFQTLAVDKTAFLITGTVTPSTEEIKSLCFQPCPQLKMQENDKQELQNQVIDAQYKEQN